MHYSFFACFITFVHLLFHYALKWVDIHITEISSFIIMWRALSMFSAYLFVSVSVLFSYISDSNSYTLAFIMFTFIFFQLHHLIDCAVAAFQKTSINIEMWSDDCYRAETGLQCRMLFDSVSLMNIRFIMLQVCLASHVTASINKASFISFFYIISIKLSANTCCVSLLKPDQYEW